MLNKKCLPAYILLLLLFIIPIPVGCGCNIETVEEHNSKIENEALERSSVLESLLSRTEADETSATVPDFEAGSDTKPDSTGNENTSTSVSFNQAETDSHNISDTKNMTENNTASVPANASVSSETVSAEAISTKALSSYSEETASEETISNETISKETIPNESLTVREQTDEAKTTAPYIMVHITVTCSKVVNSPDLSTNAVLPEDGVILDTYVAVRDGDSVFTALKTAADDNCISLGYTGSKGSVYVGGINGLYEKQCGRYSGWKYSVNNVYPNVGCGGYSLSDGDSILFGYVDSLTDTY